MALSISLLAFAACAEVEIDVPEVPGQISSALLQTVSSSEIMYCGQSDSLWVGTNDPVEYVLYRVTSEDNPNAVSYVNSRGKKVYIEKSDDFTLEQSGKYLVSSIIPDDAAGIYVATVRMQGSEDYVPVTIPVRTKVESADPAPTPVNTYDSRNLRAASVLCHPLAYDETPAVNESVVWLDKYVIAQGTSNQQQGHIKPIVSNTQGVATWNYETSGSTSESVKKSWCKDNGVGLKIPILSSLFNMGGSYKKSKKWSSSEDREWYRMTTLTVAMTATMDRTVLCLNPSYYLSQGLNKALNSKDQSILNIYPMTLEGTMKIIDDYGLYLCTTGAFGAYCQYDYSRQANVSTNSVECDAKASLGLGVWDAAKPTLGNAIMFFTKLMHNVNTAAWNATITGSFSDKEADYHRVIKSDASSIAYGGNCLTVTDYKQWSPTDNPDNWNLISYSVNNGEELTESALVSILDMIENTKSDRYKLMREALCDEKGTFLSDDCPYALHLKNKYRANPLKNKTVVADVYMMKVSGGVDEKHTNVLHERPKSLVMKDPNGIEHIYHPFIINHNGGDMVRGVNTEGKHLNNMEGYGFIMGAPNSGTDLYYFNFIIWYGNWNNNAMILYYALDDWKNCNAVEDIFIGDTPADKRMKNADGYIKRSEGDLKDIVSSSRTPHTSIFVKYVQDKDNGDFTHPRVTGVALVAGLENDHEICPNWETGYPFASTMGTEWLPNDRRVSDYYWKPGEADSLYMTVCNYSTHYLDKVSIGKKSGGYYIDNQQIGLAYGPRAYNGDNPAEKGSLRWPMRYRDNDGKYVNPSYSPALFYRFDNQDKDEMSRACIMLHYTTKTLDPEHMTAPRTAKIWPYDASK